MGFPTKVQLIHRKTSEQWYINFPSALAQAMEFSRGEVVEWFVEHKDLLALKRPDAPLPVLKKKLPTDSSKRSTDSGNSAPPASRSRASPNSPKSSR
jgi:hypothetical protein